MKRTIHVFKSGEQTSSKGNSRKFTKSEINQIKNSYNTKVHEAPLVLGHAGDDDSKPAMGWVKGFLTKGDDLYAEVDTTPAMDKLLKDKYYKKVSISLYPPKMDINPHPGKWSARHLAFLGASPPAVKGLEDFAEGEDFFCFSGFELELDDDFSPTEISTQKPEELLREAEVKYKEKKVKDSKIKGKSGPSPTHYMMSGKQKPLDEMNIYENREGTFERVNSLDFKNHKSDYYYKEDDEFRIFSKKKLYNQDKEGSFIPTFSENNSGEFIVHKQYDYEGEKFPMFYKEEGKDEYLPMEEGVEYSGNQYYKKNEKFVLLDFSCGESKKQMMYKDPDSGMEYGKYYKDEKDEYMSMMEGEDYGDKKSYYKKDDNYIEMSEATPLMFVNPEDGKSYKKFYKQGDEYLAMITGEQYKGKEMYYQKDGKMISLSYAEPEFSQDSEGITDKKGENKEKSPKQDDMRDKKGVDSDGDERMKTGKDPEKDSDEREKKGTAPETKGHKEEKASDEKEDKARVKTGKDSDGDERYYERPVSNEMSGLSRHENVIESVTKDDMINSLRKELESMKSDFLESKEENNRLRMAAKAAMKEARHNDISKWANKLYESGKLIEAIAAPSELISYCEKLAEADDSGVLEFKEDEKSLLETFKGLLDGMEPQVSFGEMKDTNLPPVEDEEELDFHEKAIKLSEEKNIKYEEAVKEVLYG